MKQKSSAVYDIQWYLVCSEHFSVYLSEQCGVCSDHDQNHQLLSSSCFANDERRARGCNSEAHRQCNIQGQATNRATSRDLYITKQPNHSATSRVLYITVQPYCSVTFRYSQNTVQYFGTAKFFCYI